MAVRLRQFHPVPATRAQHRERGEKDDAQHIRLVNQERDKKPPFGGVNPMSKYASAEVLPGNLQDHRAVKAWRQIRPECFEPQDIEILKLKRKKSAVYRLTGAGS